MGGTIPWAQDPELPEEEQGRLDQVDRQAAGLYSSRMQDVQKCSSLMNEMEDLVNELSPS